MNKFEKTQSGDYAGLDTERPDQTPRRTCLLVLGMHRSGTSALTRVLSLAGAKLPRRLMGASESNQTGHWEPDALVKYNEQLLNNVGSTWHDWTRLDLPSLGPGRREAIKEDIVEIIANEYGDAELFVVKEPRICRFATLFVDALHEKNINVAPVIPIRNPLEVIGSIMTRASNWPADTRARLWRDDYTRSDAALLWLRHILDAESATRDHTRAIVSYDALLRDWRSELAKISQLNSLQFPFKQNDIGPDVDEFLSEKLRHHTNSHDNVALDPILKGWVSNTYSALRVLSRSPNSSAAIDELDTIRRAFDGAESTLKALLADASHSVSIQLKQKVEAAGCERNAARDEAQSLAKEITAKTDQIGHLQTHIADLATKLQTSDEQIKSRDMMLAQRAKDFEAAAQARDAARDQAQILTKEIKTKTSQINDLQARIVDLTTRLQDSYEQIKSRDDLLAQRAKDLLVAARDRNAARDESQSLTEDTKVKATQISDLQARNVDLTTRLKDSFEQIKSRDEEIANVERERDIARREAQEAATKAEAEASRAKSLQETIATFIKRLQRVNDASAAPNANIEALPKELEQHFQSYDSRMQDTVHHLDDKLRQTSEHCHELSKQNEELVAELNEMQQMHDNMQLSLNNNIKDLKLKLKQTEQQFRRSRRQIEEVHTAYRSSTSWRLTAPVRGIKIIPRNIKRISSKTPEAIRLAGGFWPTVIKARRILATEGLSGLQHRLDLLDRVKKNAAPHIATSKISNADVNQVAILHQQNNAPERLAASPIFNHDWYSAKSGIHFENAIQAAQHYLANFGSQKIDPSAFFNTQAYLQANPKVRQMGINPALHYIDRQPLAPRRTETKTKHRNRIVVYTAVTDGYDHLASPAIYSENVDYVAFSENPAQAGSVWKHRPLDYINCDPTRTARFYKINPHLYFSDYDISIWVDGNLTLWAHPEALIESAGQSVQFATWHHPLRTCVYEEGRECIARSKDEFEIITAQISRYMSAGFPRNAGLFETSVLIRNHNDPTVISCMKDWWREVDNGSRRDQIGLPYALSHSPCEMSYLAPRGICMRTDHRFEYRKHQK